MDTYLTIMEAQDLLKVSGATIRRYVRIGKLPAFRLGGVRDLRFRQEDLVALLEPVIVRSP